MKIAIIISTLYVVVKETLNNYSLIKYKTTFGKAPKKFNGPNWVIMVYIFQGVFNVVFGIVFLRFINLLELDFENTMNHSALIWMFIIILNIFNWKRKKLDEEYVVEDE
tara:strand:- start:176 stop:502 length:327 start_codon:yes stop_codon:yes gene_type:complete